MVKISENISETQNEILFFLNSEATGHIVNKIKFTNKSLHL